MFTLLRQKRRPALLNLATEVRYLNLSLIKIKVSWNMLLLSCLTGFKVISVYSLTEKAMHNRSHTTSSESSDCFCADLMRTEEQGWEQWVSSSCDF